MPGTWPRPSSARSRSSRPSICPGIDPSSMPSFTSSRPLPPTRSTRSSPSATFSSAIVSKPQPENPLSGLKYWSRNLLRVHWSCGKAARTAREDFAAHMPDQFDRVPRVRRRAAAILEIAFAANAAGTRTSQFHPTAIKGRSNISLVPSSPGSLYRDLRGRGIDLAEIVGSEFECSRAQVLIQAMHLARSGDWHDPGLLRQQPGERDLGRRGIPAGRNSAEQIDEGLVGLHRFGRETREPAANVGAGEGRAGFNLSRQETLPERAPWNEADPQLFARRQHVRFRIPRPKGILALEGGDRLNSVRPPNRLRTGFGQSEIFDLAVRDQVLHRAGHVFDRHIGVNAMLIEQVDAVGPEALERCF